MGRFALLRRELRALYARDAATTRASSVHGTADTEPGDSIKLPSLGTDGRPSTSGYLAPAEQASSSEETNGGVDNAEDQAAPHEDILRATDEEAHNEKSEVLPIVPGSDNVTSEEQLQPDERIHTPPEVVDASANTGQDGTAITPLDFEQAQAVRDEAYITFSGEAAEDYTGGPSRFVLASDGVQDCAAVLMTLDFSTCIQTAIQHQREYTRARSVTTKQKWELTRLERKVQSAKSSCKTKLVGLEERQDGEDQEAKAALEQRLTILEAMLLDVQGRKQEVIVGIETKADILREVQASAIAYLEEALVCGQLVEPLTEETEPEVQKLDLEEEYLLFCDKLKAAGDPILEDEDIAPLDHNLNHLKAEPLSEGDQKKQDAVNDLWAARQTLQQARNAFENRSAQRAQEFYANQAAADAGLPTTDDSPEAFDIRWVQETAGLTRALIDAEAAWTAAKRRAVDAGVPVEFDQDDQDTVFAGVDESDCGGDRMSAEQEMVPTVSSPTMRKWLSAVPEGVEAGIADDEAEAEADDWEADEVGISDSVSLVAEGRERARIDRWRRACMGEREA